MSKERFSNHRRTSRTTRLYPVLPDNYTVRWRSLAPARFNVDNLSLQTVTTVIFVACCVSFVQFLIAVILSLPKQLSVMFIGVDYEETGTGM